MSLRAGLLSLFSLLLCILTVALGGFYWAVERSLTDQELVKTARVQLRDIENALALSHGLIAETAKFVVTDVSHPRAIDRIRKDGKASIQRLVDVVHAELKLLDRYNADGTVSSEWQLETHELDELLQIQKAYADLSDETNLLVAKRHEIGREEILSRIRACDDIVSKRLNPLLGDLRDSELQAMLLREKSMLDNSRLFERLALGTCLATFVVVVAGTYFLRRTFEDLARKEGAMAADRAKSEFLANMSHELRTPMTAILGFADILTQGVTDPDKIEAATIVKRNGEHLLSIINDILDLSKIDAGQLEIGCEPCSPSRIIADVASLMRVRAVEKGLTLGVEFVDRIPETIVSCPLRLQQILINLVGNAIKFTETGSVRLVTRLVDDKTGKPRLRFDVIDTGIGISKENIRNLFKPFTQVDSSTVRAAEGTGLGLAISRRLAQMLGGDIQAMSIPGAGSTFSATVETGPLDGVTMIDHHEALSPSPVASPPREVAQERTKLGGRVLLVEDGPDNQRLIKFLLKRADVEVTLAENGIVALEKVEQAMRAMASQGDLGTRPPFDAILMDMQMPVMDGYEVTQRLRAAGYRHPIVALTAHAMSTDRQKCLDAGCDDYATKPISEENLLAVLSAYMPGKVASGSSAN